MKKGELELPVTPGKFADMLVKQYGMKEISLVNSIMLRSASLPEIHKDPADRFIIATAFLNGCLVVTGDRRFPSMVWKRYNDSREGAML